MLVTATFNAPMSFFETTDSSVMLNRFSQDMSMIDLQLPMAAWNVLMSTVPLSLHLKFRTNADL